LTPSTAAILSLLHEPPAGHSAARRFRDRPVLGWTIARLARAQSVTARAVLCWDDQRDAVAAAAGDTVTLSRPRTPIPLLDQVNASQRWSDGWRGGLLGTCHFDRGFHAPFVHDAARHLNAEAVVLVDPAAALVDPALIDALVAHIAAHPRIEYAFTQAAPGLAGLLLRTPLVERLAKANTHPGRLFAYHPDTPGRDPMTMDMCLAVPPAVARTPHRFTLDSDRQIRRLSDATTSLNGQLIGTGAEDLVALVASRPTAHPHPREVVLEVTTDRATRPIFAPGTHLQLGRGAMPLTTLKPILDQLHGIDDLRLTIAGAGDPLLHPEFPEILRLIERANVPAVHVETDLVEPSAAALDALATARLDVLTIHLPAATAPTYQRVMSADALNRVIENLKRLLALRRSVPLIVPTFTKCRANLDEMEAWYDHWIRVLGTAVIAGPSDYAGQIPDAACADMSPPKRRPCARLDSRLTILSDGAVVACEQDALRRHPLGRVPGDDLSDLWQHRLAPLRGDHATGSLHHRPLCLACKEWHRP
jgi:spiro-SPASM protein